MTRRRRDQGLVGELDQPIMDPSRTVEKNAMSSRVVAVSNGWLKTCSSEGDSVCRLVFWWSLRKTRFRAFHA